MTKHDTPRDETTGERLCEQCHRKPVPPSLGTKPRLYCGRNCRQRAYESRKTGTAITTAVNSALAREAKSRDSASPSPASSRQDRAKSRDNAEVTSRDVAEEAQLTLEIPEPAAAVEPESASEDVQRSPTREELDRESAMRALMAKAMGL
ncbi:hypothetical protein [Streptomyces sp. NPDC001205]